MTDRNKPRKRPRRSKPTTRVEDNASAMSLEQIMGSDPDNIRIEKPPRQRLTYLDAVRGLVIALMAIDHARDYWTPTSFQPTNFNADGGGWQFFFTRWLTHLCAPTFVLLAGMGAWLWRSRGRSKSQLSVFLLTRGAWLIFIEFAVISIWWQLPFGVLWKGFDPSIVYPWSQVPVSQFPPAAYMAQVIWAIGASMVVLAGLIWLPVPVIAGIAVVTILGHNSLDKFNVNTWGPLGPRTDMSWTEKLHAVAHSGFGAIPLPNGSVLTTNRTWMNVYPLVPWFAVLALGYSLGSLTTLIDSRRRKTFLLMGLCFLAAFTALRFTNWYGDPDNWSEQLSTLKSVMSFVNVQKYPPSALYLLVMIGMCMVLLATIDLLPKTIVWILTVYGRVPFLFYVLHLPLLWVSTSIMIRTRFGDEGEHWSLGAHAMPGKPQLWWTYAAWIGVLIALFPVCYAFGKIKQNSKAWWLSYL